MVARAAALVAASGIVTWGAVGHVGPRPLLLDASFQYLALCCVALVLAGSLVGSAYGRAMAWAGLALVGHATALQLIESGPAVRYPHWGVAVGSAGEDGPLLVALGVYAGVVAIGLAPHARAVVGWVRRHIGVAGAVLVVGAAALLSASPMRDVRDYALEVAIATAFGLVSVGNVFLIARATPAEAIERLSGWLARRLPVERRIAGVDAVAVLAAAALLVVSAVLALFVWERHPHLSDEISFLYQAKYFAAGMLVAPGAPVPEAFSAYQIHCTVERCLSVLQPGWPLVLSAGYRLGVPWLVNPLLGALNVVLTFLLLREWYGARTARLGALLLALSPWSVFLAMSFMTHQMTLAAGLLAALGTTAVWRGRSPTWALLAGAGAGVTSLMRPLDGLYIAAVCGTPLLLSGSWRTRSIRAVAFVAGAIGLGSINLVYNRAVTGNPFEFPVTTYFNRLFGEGANNLGFGADRGVYPMWAHLDAMPGHSPLQAGLNALINATAIHFEMFGWAAGSLVPVLLLLAFRRLRRIDVAMLGALAVLVACYSLYWFASGPDFVARYWFLGIVPLIALTVRGLEELGDRLPADGAGGGRWRLAPAVAYLAVSALLVMVPWRSADKYYRYVASGPGARGLVESGRYEGDVFVVSGKSQPDYAAAMIYNPLDLRSSAPVFAFDTLAGMVPRLQLAYPGRRIVRLEGPSITGGDYRIVSTVQDSFDVALPNEPSRRAGKRRSSNP